MPLTALGDRNLDQILNECRIRVSRLGQTDLQNEDIIVLLDSALQWMAGKLRYAQTEDTLTSVAAQANYTLGSSIHYLRAVRYDGTLIRPTSRERLDVVTPQWREESDNTPVEWFVDGNDLFLRPAPDTAGDDIDIDYYMTAGLQATSSAAPPEMSQFAVSLLPIAFQFIWMGTPEGAGLGDRDMVRAEFEDRVDLARQSINRRSGFQHNMRVGGLSRRRGGR